jgi:hypothetical protein
MFKIGVPVPRSVTLMSVAQATLARVMNARLLKMSTRRDFISSFLLDLAVAASASSCASLEA